MLRNLNVTLAETRLASVGGAREFRLDVNEEGRTRRDKEKPASPSEFPGVSGQISDPAGRNLHLREFLEFRLGNRFSTVHSPTLSTARVGSHACVETFTSTRKQAVRTIAKKSDDSLEPRPYPVSRSDATRLCEVSRAKTLDIIPRARFLRTESGPRSPP